MTTEDSGNQAQQATTEARRYRRRRSWIRATTLLSVVVLVAFTARQIIHNGSPIPTNTLTAISPSDYADSDLSRTVRVRNLTFTLERACRGYSDHKTGPTDTRPFTVAKTPWAVGYHAVRRSREPSPWMFAAGVVGESQGTEIRQPIVAFYDPGGERKSAGTQDPQGIVPVDKITGNCLISVYATNCEWEIGIYRADAGGKPEPNSTVATRTELLSLEQSYTSHYSVCALRPCCRVFAESDFLASSRRQHASGQLRRHW